MKVNWQTVVFGRHLEIKFWRENALKDCVVGINSNLDNDWHTLFIDYDDVLQYDALVREIKYLQRKFKLGNAWIFESSYHHYYVCFFQDRMKYWEALEIIHEATCCREFKRWRMIRKEMTLRLTAKAGYSANPKFLKIIYSPNEKNWTPSNFELYKAFMKYAEIDGSVKYGSSKK